MLAFLGLSALPLNIKEQNSMKGIIVVSILILMGMLFTFVIAYKGWHIASSGGVSAKKAAVRAGIVGAVGILALIWAINKTNS